MESQFTGLEQFLLGQLECPVCMKYMRPPIMLCENGHNVCNTCKQKLPHCPICRQQFLNTRNLALEKLARALKYPCTSRKYGCREIYSFRLIVIHQEKCQYTPQPSPINKLNIGHCIWLGISSNIRSHLKQAHPSMCVEYYGLGQGSIPIRGVTPDTKNCKFIFADNYAFCCCTEIKNGAFYCVLKYISPVENAAKHRYRVEIYNKERTESLAVTRLARSFDEDLSEVHNSGNCVKLYPEQYNGFANDGSELAFSMDIQLKKVVKNLKLYNNFTYRDVTLKD